MDPEFSQFVEAANDIRTSGRWESVNATIKRTAASGHLEGAWYLQVVSGICYEVFSEYLAIRQTYENERRGDVSLLAWRARNLLELSVWSNYCDQDTNNARRLYEDAGRDAIEIFSAFSNWGSKTNQELAWREPLERSKVDVRERAAAEGAGFLEGPYKRVSEAAEECGMHEHFRVMYKLLSKFAHPTAIQLVATTDRARTVEQRDMFYSNGCLYFGGAFEALERLLNS